jgi:class 3 adenylate cyclase
MAPTRRLAAILAADLYGYSRLMGDDEEGTLRRLKRVQADLLDPKFAAHGGRLVKTTGDGFLVEFSSVIGALRCASEIQAGMSAQAPVPESRRLMFRIGIHQGDIVVDDNDIFGNGVNIAARLEGIAEPGGICVSARVQEDAVGRIDLEFEDIGEQQLKNIARTVRVFRVHGGSAVHGPEGEAAAAPLQPDTTLPDTTLPETTLPETTLPETTLPETTLPETTLEEAILARLGHKVEIVESPGAWLALSRERQTALPVGGRSPGTRNQLGVDATLGSRVPSPQARVMLRIGPLDGVALGALLPGQPGMHSLISLMRDRLGAEVEFAVNPVVAGAGLAPLRLDGEPGTAPRLGWNTWIPGLAPRGDAADACEAVFPVDAATAGTSVQARAGLALAK